MANYRWIKSKYEGVRYREHPQRIFRGKPDRLYQLFYRRDGKQFFDSLGWASQWNPQDFTKFKNAKLFDGPLTEKRASNIRNWLQSNYKLGQRPTTLKEAKETIKRENEKRTAKERQNRVINLTFAEFFKDTYLPQAEQNKVTDSIRREKNLFHLWINPVIGDKPLRKIDILDLERIKKRMGDANRSARSVQYCLAVIRQVFNLARALGIYEGDNPVSKIKKPSVDNRRLRFLTREEADLLLDELKKRSQQLHDIALLSLHCGLRAGEIFNLTWDCIDFEQEQILIKDPKNKSNRYAFMTEQVKAMLQRRYQGQLNGLVFTDRKGNKIKEVSNSFARAVKEIGLNEGIDDRRQKVVFHSLRHTYASWLVEQGVDLFVIKELMGHKSLVMTERYSHLGQNTLKQAVQKLNKAINRPKGKVLEFPKAINE